MALRTLRVPLLTILLGCLAGGADSTAPLVNLVPESGTDRLYPIVDQNTGRLKWSHNAFVFNDVMSPYFYTIDTEGNLIEKAFLNEPDDGVYYIADFDRRDDGTIAVAAAPVVDDELSPFIAWIAPDGSTKQLVKTAPYYPTSLTFAEDGTVWTLGYEMIHRRTEDPALDPSDGVLRQFARGGKMIASALPQRDYIGSKRREITRVSSGKLCAVHQHLVWYSSISGDARYVEIPMDKIELHIYPGVPKEMLKGFPSIDVETFTAMDTGDSAVSLQGGNHHATFLLDRASGQWRRLNVPSVGGSKGFEPKLVGSQGDQLVFAHRTSAEFFRVEH